MKPIANTRKTDYSTTRVTSELLEEIRSALKNVRGWGSVEIYIQNGKVTQITERSIKKTDHDLMRDVS